MEEALLPHLFLQLALQEERAPPESLPLVPREGTEQALQGSLLLAPLVEMAVVEEIPGNSLR